MRARRRVGACISERVYNPSTIPLSTIPLSTIESRILSDIADDPMVYGI